MTGSVEVAFPGMIGSLSLHYLLIMLQLIFLLQSLIVAHDKFKITLGDADKELQAIVGLENQVHEMSQKFGMTGRIENPYTTLNANVS